LAELKTWSYSSATTFEKCPKQYYHLYVAKDIKQDPNTEHFLYGNEVHKACELYVKSATPLPEKFNMFQPTLDKLIAIPGDKYCEYKLGLTKDLEPCDFFASNVWWRGVVDLLVINPETKLATLIDYKTGKSSQYADTRQLSLFSVAIFKHFPDMLKVKSGLVFLVSKEILKEDYTVDKIDDMFAEWGKIVLRINGAYESGVFNASP
jgi:hypothetical protein